MRHGHFVRHIRRMRMLYLDRRKALLQAIDAHMKDTLEVLGDEAGMHLVALLPPGVNDLAIAQRAAEQGISAMPLSSCYARAPQRGGLILGYGGANAYQIRNGIRVLRRICEAHSSGRSAASA